ncbi:MAG: hypothetical protein OEW39_08925 [Deltaproteobacteria bacterium]|nr:hypothetical protein [Deltaproteobacteria bacterium]
MNKKIGWALIVALMVTGVALEPAWGVEKGFGLYGGMASHSSKGTINPGYLGAGLSFSYSSSGTSIGFDYQFPIGDSFSINPFLMSSSETGSGDLNPGTSVGHGIFGVEIRYWMSTVFLGFHVGNYSEVLINSQSSTSVGGAGTGFGATIGWDNGGGWFVSAQTDSASLIYADANVEMSGIRLQVGYHWY